MLSPTSRASARRDDFRTDRPYPKATLLESAADDALSCTVSSPAAQSAELSLDLEWVVDPAPA